MRIADDRLRVLAASHSFQIIEKALPDQEDSADAGGQVLRGPIGNPSLPHPGDEILIHDVARDPTARGRVAYRSVPCGNELLHVRLALCGNPAEGPRDAQS